MSDSYYDPVFVAIIRITSRTRNRQDSSLCCLRIIGVSYSFEEAKKLADDCAVFYRLEWNYRTNTTLRQSLRRMAGSSSQHHRFNLWIPGGTDYKMAYANRVKSKIDKLSVISN